jgi:hypothetical protein
MEYGISRSVRDIKPERHSRTCGRHAEGGDGAPTKEVKIFILHEAHKEP